MIGYSYKLCITITLAYFCIFLQAAHIKFHRFWSWVCFHISLSVIFKYRPSLKCLDFRVEGSSSISLCSVNGVGIVLHREPLTITLQRTTLCLSNSLSSLQISMGPHWAKTQLKATQSWHWKPCLETRDGLIFCYSHRTVPYSIIREAVFNSIWGQMQRPTAKHQTETEYKWKVSIKSFPQSSGYPEKMEKPGGGDTRIARSSESTKLSQMKSQKLKHGPTCFCTRSFVYVLHLLAYYFYGTPDCGNKYVFDYCWSSLELFPIVELPWSTLIW